MFRAFQKNVFGNFFKNKSEKLSGKSRQRVQICLNVKLVIGNFIENEIQSMLMKVLSVWIWHFSLFCKLLSNEVEAVFWKTKAKPSILFKYKVVHTVKKIVFKLPWRQKRIFWASENAILHFFFSNFWVAMLKLFTGKEK